MKKLKKPGKSTSKIEILNVNGFGVWINVAGEEFFLSYTRNPWFKKATLEEILDCSLFRGHHLHWPKLDVDLEIESLRNPQHYPLIARHA